MALQEFKVKDTLRGRNKEVVIRFDGNDLVKLPCHCKYDSALQNEVLLVRKVELKESNGEWVLYPSATWLDGVEYDGQLVSRAIVKKTNEEGFDIMSSPEGVPDGKLLIAAEEIGVYTESF